MHYDDMLRRLGGFGRYQVLQVSIACFLIINTTMHAFNMVFTAAVPKHRCHLQEVPSQWDNLTDLQKHSLTYKRTGDSSVDSCTMYALNETDWDHGNYTTWVSDVTRNTTQCQYGWDYDTDIYKSTIVTQWDFVCDSDWYQSMAMSVFFMGRLFGSSISGQASDWCGRRPVLIMSILLLAASGIVASFCRIFWLFCIFYFCQGFFQISLFNCIFILCTEMVGPSYRLYTGVAFHISYALGEVVLAGVSVLLRRWNFILLTISISGLPFLISFWLVPESVRWLLTKDRGDEAQKVITKVAKVNGKVIEPNLITQLDVTTNQKRSSVIDLFRHCKLAKLALNVWFQGVASLLVYYGINFNSPNLAGDPYLNFTLLGCAEVLSLVIILVISRWIGEKKLYLSFMTLAGAGCLSLAFVPKENLWLCLFSAILGKFGAAGTCVLLNVITLTVFPTSVRNSAFGVAKTLALTGAMVAPYVIYLHTVFPALPQLIFATFAILALISAFFIPETTGKSLPQNISDMFEKSEEKDYHDKLRRMEEETVEATVKFMPKG